MKQSVKTSALLAVLSSVCVGAQAEGTDDMATPPPAANAPSAGPGMKVYIDPETGKFLEQPPKGTEPTVTPSVALPEPEQVNSPEPGGGVMVDVKGRFQTPITVTIDPQGKPVIDRRDTR